MTPSPRLPVRALAFAVVFPLAHACAAVAQPVLGPLSWQLQPFCNVVTLTLTSGPAGFALDGTDNLCGASNKASAVGVASPNTSGQYTLNFSVVTAPSARPVHVSAIVSPASGNGTWTDSLGHSGTFAFFGNASGLAARPVPVSGLPPASVTAAEIAPGSVGTASINTAQVQARVTGSCALGEAMTGVNANGSVACLPAAPYARFRAQNANNLALAASSSGIITWSSNAYNIGFGTYDAAAGTYAVPSTGTYLITGSAEFTPVAGPSGYYCLVLTVGGLDGQTTCSPQSAAALQIPMLSTVRQLSAGAVLSIRAVNGSMSAQTVAGINSTSEFTVTRIQ